MNDPLEVIYEWPLEVRTLVAMALKPHVRIQEWNGEIRWLDKKEFPPSVKDTIRHLAKATSYEMLRTPKYKNFYASSETAKEMANRIWMYDSANPGQESV